jgi:hypothetical protein
VFTWERCLLLCIACVAAWPAEAADGAADDAARRERLAAERAAAQVRYDDAVRGCQSVFAVTGCINQARAERRAALDRVSREQATLDDAARKRRTEERRQRIAQKQQAAAARAAASAPEVQLRAPRQAPAASGTRPSRRAEPRSAEAAAAAEAAASQRQAQSAQRRERAKSHEQAVQRREAERNANRAPAAPLPVPSASAVAR